MEEWKTIAMHPDYAVSSLGRVRRIVAKPFAPAGRFLTPWVQSNGYLCVTLTSDKKRSVRLHRLVADAFVPNPDSLPQVNHKDGNKQNCQADNLEWSTALSNLIHALKNGLRQKKGYTFHKKARKWMAYIGQGNQQVYLGLFDTEQDAINARQKAESTHYPA